jgi:hypothetical protein
MATKKSAEAPKYVIVATSYRPWSIVAGELLSQGDNSVILRNARMIAYYSLDARTVFGCAANGPGTGARVSPRVDEATIRGVEHILLATPTARAAIEAEPWR